MALPTIRLVGFFIETMYLERTLEADYKPIPTESMITFLNEDMDMDVSQKQELDALMLGALADMEAYTHRHFGRSTYSWRMSGFGEVGEKIIFPEVKNVASVTVKTKNVAGTWVELDAENYKLDEAYGRSTITWNTTVSAVLLGDFSETVEVSFMGGYESGFLPSNMETGLKLWVRNVWDGTEDDKARNDTIERLWNGLRIYGV